MTCRKIFYAYCLKLDQSTRNNIVSEFQLRTLDTSIKSLLPHGVLKKSDYPSVAISCPENKIPMWFMYQSESSSINVKLYSVRQNPNFLGFALCAVVVEDISCLELSCEANFKTKYGKSYKFHWNFNNFSVCSRPLGILSNSSNVFMWYKHENYHGSLDTEAASFRFYDKLGRGNIVRACGIRPLYYQDAEELGITSKLGKTNVIKLYSSSQIYPR
ncbi:hypothetical protein TIFTF001_039422 [Ficus carica]|uniref:C-JID domain-containing protein n=1 Tax=Ficus carica TaxID=3494 RepID=A0AA88E941_FICCA|nr:hypothetical protein TIFTF001_039410 [Ficus carica]GMN70378.1 hypothetical protein TIFTF001_039422 [Ficus carica]